MDGWIKVSSSEKVIEIFNCFLHLWSKEPYITEEWEKKLSDNAKLRARVTYEKYTEIVQDNRCFVISINHGWEHIVDTIVLHRVPDGWRIRRTPREDMYLLSTWLDSGLKEYEKRAMEILN